MGLHEFKVLPFGLVNALAIFQQTMNHLFGDKIGKSMVVYLDNIVVYNKDANEHLQHFKEVLDVLRKQKF